MIKELEKEENLEEELNSDIVIIDFFATWCGPCKMLAPILEKYVEENINIKVIKIDVDNFPSLAKQHTIMSVPTLLFYKNKNLIRKEIGFKSINEIDDIVKSL